MTTPFPAISISISSLDLLLASYLPRVNVADNSRKSDQAPADHNSVSIKGNQQKILRSDAVLSLVLNGYPNSDHGAERAAMNKVTS